MAINTSSLTAYVGDNKEKLISKAVIGAKSASKFNLVTGVKGAQKLNLLDTTVSLQDGSACGWTEAGTSKLSQRTIEAKPIKVNQSFCDKQLLATSLNYEVKVAAGQKTLPFEEEFVNGVIDGVAAEVEKTIWQGDTSKSTLNRFDGLIKILSGATVAGTYSIQSGDTVSTIVSKTYALIPSAAYQAGNVVMYMGSDMYRTWIQELIAKGLYPKTKGEWLSKSASGHLVISNAVEDVAMPDSLLIPGTNVRVEGVAGLDGTKKVYASYADNFVFGTDMQGDEEKAELWYSKDNREFRLALEFVAGVQVAFPELVAVAK